MSENGSGGVRVEKDVLFGKGGDVELRCDIYRPRFASDKRTAVIQIHGGAFARGNRGMTAAACTLFAERGYVGVATQYRLADQAKWPSQIQDIKACIRWVRANAVSLDIDPARIVIAGHSAGAHLALCAAGTENRPEFEGDGGNAGVGTELAACLAYYSPERTAVRPDGTWPVLMAEGSTVEDMRRASPITYMNNGCPPTVLFHGTKDAMINHETSLHFFYALQAAGVPVELHLVEGVSHEFDNQHPEFGNLCADFADLFIDRHVINPRVYPPFMPGGMAAHAAPAAR